SAGEAGGKQISAHCSVNQPTRKPAFVRKCSSNQWVCRSLAESIATQRNQFRDNGIVEVTGSIPVGSTNRQGLGQRWPGPFRWRPMRRNMILGRGRKRA